jgi:hypothetical protein
MYCSHCAQQLSEEDQFCKRCGSSTGPRVAPPPASQATLAAAPQFPYWLSFYYQNEFTRIVQSRGVYRGQWNWAAFFFGAFWGLSKGLWVPSLIAIVGALFTGGIVGVIYWFIFGVRGNYMYFAKMVEHRDVAI